MRSKLKISRRRLFDQLNHPVNHTPLRFFGRHSGASALDPKPRTFSKKQKARQLAARRRRQERVFPHKEKMKAEFAAKRLDIPSTEAFMSRLDQNLADIMQEWLLPLPDSELLGTDDNKGTTLLMSGSQSRDILNLLETKQKSNSNNTEKISGTKIKSQSLLPVQSSSSSSSVVSTNISHDDVNLAVVSLVVHRNSSSALQLILKANELGIPIEQSAYIAVMNGLNREKQMMMKGKHKKQNKENQQVIDLFGKMVRASGIDPSPRAYEELIKAYIFQGQITESLKCIDGLLELGVQPTTNSYRFILSQYAFKSQWTKLEEFWMRMKADGVVLNKECFHPMLRWCAKTGRAERALFLMDELYTHGLEADLRIFTQVFRACAEAPHWVHGYEDIVFDVMSRFEGAELIPDAHIYGAVIYAFGRAGDADAAWFYYKEMLRKDIKPTLEVYNQLLYALGRHQAVGVAPFGKTGRYVRPKRIIGGNAEEEAYLKIGPQRAAELMSQSMVMNGNAFSHKSVRNKPTMVNIAAEAIGDHDQLELNMMEEVMSEAESEGDWRLNELRRREEEAWQERRKSRYVGFYRPNDDTDMLQLDSSDNNNNDNKYNKDERQGEGYGTSDDDMDELLSELEWADPTEVLERLEQAGIKPEGDDFNIDVALEVLHGMASDGPTPEDKEFPTDTDTEVDIEKDTVSQLSSSQSTLNSLLDAADQLDGLSDMNPGAVARANMNAMTNALLSTDIDRVDTSTHSHMHNNDYGNNNDNNNGNRSIEHMREMAKAAQREQWSLVEFGRAGDPDYTESLSQIRWPRNKDRARNILRDMDTHDIAPDEVTMNNLLMVYAEAKDVDGAMNVLRDDFTKANIRPYQHAYNIMIRMHVRRGEWKDALKGLDIARAKGIRPSGEAVGLVLHTLTKRDLLVEALQLLEEATYDDVNIPEKHIKLLRLRCKKLGVKHPDMPSDPYQWVRDMHETRKKLKLTSQKRVQGVRSKLFS